nr:NUDIX domain-containing protein [Flavobacterium sp. 1]
MRDITIDCAVFGYDNGSLKILLVQHGEGVSMNQWGLPGGWITEKEHIKGAAYRLLKKVTGLDNIYLKQLKAFGAPDRYPAARIVTIGYYAIIKRTDYSITAGGSASDAQWYSINDVPELAFDHSKILKYALKRLRKKVKKTPIGFSLLPKKFTLLELMRLYEEILGYEMDKPNFRRKFLNMKLLKPLSEKQQNVKYRAAQLYEFDPEIYQKLTKKGFSFEF